MTEPLSLFDDGWIYVDLDEELYPREAVQGAAYVLLERAYVFLEPAGEGQLRARIRAKSGDNATIGGELENEALFQVYRRRLASRNRVLIESLASRALAGAAGPPGLDDLLAMDIGTDTAFDDPLGIAMSWEERYANAKKKDKPQAAPPTPATESPSPAPLQSDDPSSPAPEAGTANAPEKP
jgi:His-Xaa-Ser system protein HxsD